MKKEELRTAFRRWLSLAAGEIRYAAEKARYAGGTFTEQDEASLNAFLNIMNQRLPDGFAAGRGYIVDTRLNDALPFDVIITGGHAAGPLFKDEDGSAYYALESVYALGNIKAEYTAGKKDIEDFTNRLSLIERKLKRSDSFSGSIPGSVFVRNPEIIDPNIVNVRLFSFVLFVRSRDFSISQIQGLYNNYPPSKLPSCLCLMDKGVLEFSHIENNQISKLSSFNMTEIPLRGRNRWVFSSYGSGTESGADPLGTFLYTISEFLKQASLPNYDLRDYLPAILNTAYPEIIEKQDIYESKPVKKKPEKPNPEPEVTDRTHSISNPLPASEPSPAAAEVKAVSTKRTNGETKKAIKNAKVSEPAPTEKKQPAEPKKSRKKAEAVAPDEKPNKEKPGKAHPRQDKPAMNGLTALNNIESGTKTTKKSDKEKNQKVGAENRDKGKKQTEQKPEPKMNKTKAPKSRQKDVPPEQTVTNRKKGVSGSVKASKKEAEEPMIIKKASKRKTGK